MTEYKLVMKENFGGDFQKEINALIRRGWRPQGGVSIVRDNVGLVFCQAMVKTK
jgi:hypothetical protein